MEPEPPSESMLWGLRLEPAIAAAFEERTGHAVINTQLHCTHADHEWMKATIDGKVEGKDSTIVEMKACGSWMARGLPDDGDAAGLPEAWVIQGQHQLAVTGQSLVIFAVFADMALRLYELPRNDDMIAEIIRLEEPFWQMILDGTPPAEFDGADIQAITRHFNRVNDPPLELSPLQFGHTVYSYRKALGEVKASEAERDHLKAKLLLAMGNAPAATCGSYRLKRSIVQTKERVQTVKASEYVRFSVSNGEDNE
jgi:hypothetical protein